uniref:Dynein cytoplasmic 1 heavy chain 1 n=1 Tax=Terrapene triunguis TaxID=2587831 RepID=A0A674JBB5_9SAUR
MNGLSVYQIKVHRKYTGEDFDEDLRTVFRRSGCKNEKIAFIMDESNVLDSGFLEKMNNLLPNYIVPDYMPVVYEKLPQPPSHREAIVNSCVFVHQTLHQANARLAKWGGRTMAITPRHYLDFINHYVNLFNEKRSELEEQQMHLNVGLRKIKETVDQVEELRRDLRIKSQELEVKNAAANDKLKKMVKHQQEAEKKKVMSQDIQEKLHEQQAVIADKQMSVKEELDKVEPAVIDQQQLVEVRSMANPPGAVKLALESICLLLGESTTDWKQIRSIIMRENFIPTIVNFSAEEISDSIREKMKKNYMSNPSYNYEIVNRASLACGPMVKWAIAQLNYADMLKRVEPLRNELQKLEDDAKDNQQKANEVEQMIRDLEASIARYKEEYAVLISEAQAIKADLAAVEAKVNRSTALLKNLSAERERWEKTSETFKNQMSTIAGDCLLSGAFIAYAGYFDQQMRQNLFTTWSHHLQQANIQFRTDIARTEYLSNADERLCWQASSLPADDLCTENAIMLKRFNRYPLIIDPSGQATEFIMNEYKDRKITRTSFLDDAFRKNLESALRFGNPLLVQDVESYDPILNPVLNHEVRRTGGRVLITLGDQDIDLSPSFVIFLSTRDPTVEFPPDLCSRVTFVNFTITRSSLQSQCLNEVLKAERPDVDEKRSDLLKLQGRFLKNQTMKMSHN